MHIDIKDTSCFCCSLKHVFVPVKGSIRATIVCNDSLDSSFEGRLSFFQQKNDNFISKNSLSYYSTAGINQIIIKKSLFVFGIVTEQ